MSEFPIELLDGCTVVRNVTLDDRPGYAVRDANGLEHYVLVTTWERAQTR